MRLPIIRLTVRRMMIVIAVVGIMLAAWLYHIENRDIQRSLAGIQLSELQRPDGTARQSAAENLASVAPDDLAPVISRLVAALNDADWQVRQAAARSIGSAIRGSVAARKGAVAEELNLGTQGLIRALADQQPEVRLEAVVALGVLHDTVSIPSAVPGAPPLVLTIGPTDQRPVAPLRKLLNDPDPKLRIAAIRTFARVALAAGAKADPVIALIKNDPAPSVRAAAISALALGWPDPNLTYPLLLNHWKVASSQEERSAIGWALESLPAPPIETQAALVEALNLNDPVLRRTIPKALTKLGPLARPALPALAVAAHRELAHPENSALEAAEAIVRIDPDSTEAQAQLQSLAELLLNSPEPFVRQQAGWVLSAYGPSAAPTVPFLRMTLRHASTDTRDRVIYLLGRIGPAAQSALEDLNTINRDNPDPTSRQSIREAIRRIRVD